MSTVKLNDSALIPIVAGNDVACENIGHAGPPDPTYAGPGLAQAKLIVSEKLGCDVGTGGTG